MATNYRQRPSRWFPESESLMREEQEPPHMHRAPERVALLESPSFDPRTCTTCSEPARDCTCCRECNEPAVFDRLCEPHHRLTVEREQRESFESAERLLMQLRMAGAI